LKAKYFIDTNVFVYSFDNRVPEKQARSLSIIYHALDTGEGVISAQVIQEFLNVATKKFATPLRFEDSLLYLQKVLYPLCQGTPDLELFATSLQIQAETSYSYYDSQILAAVIRAGCETLFSEDFQSGQQVHGVRILNPYI